MEDWLEQMETKFEVRLQSCQVYRISFILYSSPVVFHE